ncbi:MCE family protein [Synechococcus sp. HB1133]|uniref:MlaD family protein n=1 Tax=unclassified Synechococcus TaxID=2626047 RepID=UPI0014078577|nr:MULTISPECIES: MlaD family protein [unclassified Synechococcus]MCB4393846.1 MCE family protein [Synechococcus sp. PH41509]MCB4421326.1 MCE family protein [Synechococcus sp. HB1133]MCB4431323.1 MCE family protein [Synechococcus sp. HBA1120]NHI80268.1 MCE family protein [Synechococcus sp. HB1133]
MRRSVRDAIVGFTVIGGIIGFASAALWLRGVRLGSSYWTLTARFNDAAGLAERSPVTYRGILVGSVRSIAVTPEAVVAELEIDKGDLILPLPVTATVASGSLLGGDAQVSIVSRGTPLPQDAPLPRAADCQPSRQLCNGGTLVGREAPSLSTVTATMQELLAQVQDERVIPNVAASLEQIEATTKEFQALTVQLQAELAKAGPVIRNLEAATAHANNIASSLDNPQTLSALKQTATNAAQLTAKIDAVGGDVAQLTGDPEFMKGVRNLTIGLGELFGEIYPAQTAQ